MRVYTYTEETRAIIHNPSYRHARKFGEDVKVK